VTDSIINKLPYSIEIIKALFSLDHADIEMVDVCKG